ncbi:hypothetical protein JRO89_XS10G0101100 [Xanthoceras sorbifolium]|uniref:Uncharacterized protein n=1 Tax=Xanthoceras sorbifolium TaxID=99658 RepID=A0ABQ8HIB3_9ROSI|nr:hypothetical protein JRO89_XS10G0101100 [Xanthoceras sorbifolium]
MVVGLQWSSVSLRSSRRDNLTVRLELVMLSMDENEFRRLLDLFPVVRSRDYQFELDSSRQSTSQSAQNEQLKEWQDAWDEGCIKPTMSQGIDIDSICILEEAKAGGWEEGMLVGCYNI